MGLPLFVKDGRRAMLTPAARSYHDLISQGFERLLLAQDYIVSHRLNDELTISGLPTLLQKWLNPILHRFRAAAGEVPIRIVATPWSCVTATSTEVARLCVTTLRSASWAQR